VTGGQGKRRGAGKGRRKTANCLAEGRGAPARLGAEINGEAEIKRSDDERQENGGSSSHESYNTQLASHQTFHQLPPPSVAAVLPFFVPLVRSTCNSLSNSSTLFFNSSPSFSLFNHIHVNSRA
jgi:hypothetical protein